MKDYNIENDLKDETKELISRYDENIINYLKENGYMYKLNIVIEHLIEGKKYTDLIGIGNSEELDGIRGLIAEVNVMHAIQENDLDYQLEKEVESGEDIDIVIKDKYNYDIEVYSPNNTPFGPKVTSIPLNDNAFWNPIETTITDKSKISLSEKENPYFVAFDTGCRPEMKSRILNMDEDTIRKTWPKQFEAIDGIILFDSNSDKKHNSIYYILYYNSNKKINHLDNILNLGYTIEYRKDRDSNRFKKVKISDKYDNIENKPATIEIRKLIDENIWVIKQYKSSYPTEKHESISDVIDIVNKIRRQNNSFTGLEPVKIKKEESIEDVILGDISESHLESI